MRRFLLPAALPYCPHPHRKRLLLGAGIAGTLILLPYVGVLDDVSHGCALATVEVLLARGCHVSVVTRWPDVGTNLEATHIMELVRERWADKSVEVFGRAFVRRVAPGEHLVQRPRRHELHHDPRLAAGLEHVVDPHDVRMVQRRSSSGFDRESRPGVGLRVEPGVQKFDGDRPVQPRVPPVTNLSHAAPTEDAAKLGIEPTAKTKTMVSPTSRMLSATSFGVLWRCAPSTRPIIRSRKVSPARAVPRTVPVTLERPVRGA